MSELTKGAEITVVPAEGEYVKLVSIISGTASPAIAADGEGNLPGHASSKYLKAQSEPKGQNQVVVLDEGIEIKAGELARIPERVISRM